MASTLIYITSTFPYGGITEQSFIMPELEPLAKEFDRVILVPEHLDSETPMCPLPKGVETDSRFAKVNGRPSSLASQLKDAIHPKFAAAFIHGGTNMLHYSRFRSLLSYFSSARRFADFIRKNYLPESGKFTFYTFWCHYCTTAFALIPNAWKAKIVSRAHGYDIFDHRVTYRSHYLRRQTFKRLTALYPQSSDGAEYIIGQYPSVADKISVRFLGNTRIYHATNPPADSDEITFCTVARFHPVKRLPQTATLLGRLAKVHPDKRFRWILIGDGSDRTAIEQEIEQAPSNLTVELRGQMDNADIQHLYATCHIDFFLLLSSSEGTPIALCEALAYGIPIVPSHVGGMPALLGSEKPGVVAPDGGITIEPSLDSRACLIALKPLIESSDLRCKMRAAALANWEHNFNASQLRPAFAKLLSGL